MSPINCSLVAILELHPKHGRMCCLDDTIASFITVFVFAQHEEELSISFKIILYFIYFNLGADVTHILLKRHKKQRTVKKNIVSFSVCRTLSTEDDQMSPLQLNSLI